MSGQYQVFARKYRPRTFHDVLGQEHVVQTLRNAIAKDRLAHAYLFVGPRGTGKTSTARILAKALNVPGGPNADFDPDDPICREIGEGNSLDVLEIDGASNNGVDQVRELRETVKFSPSSGKYKIYYIDEVHMLSTAAFNALLKTLEEPPEHVKFIFATTEPQKILPTIISRCQRFDLRRIPTDIIADHLKFIASQEGIVLSQSAAFAIAKGAEGGMRDAQSMLDQLVAFCGDRIEEANVLEIFGFNSLESIAELAGLILSRDNSLALQAILQHHDSGKDLSKLLADVIGHFRNVLVCQVDPKANVGELPVEVREAIAQQVSLVDAARLLRVIDILAETDAKMKWAPNKRLHLEIGTIKAIQALGESSLDDVISLVARAAKGAAEVPFTPPARSAAPATQSQATAVVRHDTLPAAPSEPMANPPEATPAPPIAAPEPLAVEPPPPATAPSGTKGTYRGEDLWQAASAQIGAKNPMLGSWFEHATFLSHQDLDFTVGFATAQKFFREGLQMVEPEVEAGLRELSGQELKLVVEIRDELTPPEINTESEEEFPLTHESVPMAMPDPPAAPVPSPQEEVTLTPDEQEDFKSDPLIQEALRIFKAKIVK